MTTPEPAATFAPAQDEHLFSGTPIPQDAKCGWKERHDAINKFPDRPMPPPWNWEVHDHSMATLCGGGEDAIIGQIMCVGPCPACSERNKDAGWRWGSCTTPSWAEARLIAAAPELLATCDNAEAVMSIVEPRSDKAEYLKALAQLRAAVAKATRDIP